MPNHLSILGIFHTAISILAILVAIFALLRYGRINPKNGTGKLYIGLTVIACLSALPIMKTGHISPGHPLAVIILVLWPIAFDSQSIKLFGKWGIFVQTVLMSMTLFLSMIPATVETLPRLPLSHPLAADPNAPIIKMGLTGLIIVFIMGTIYQLLKLNRTVKNSATPDNSIHLS